MRWQMALYKEMAGKAEDADAPVKVVKRVQEVSAVLYHLEVVCYWLWGTCLDRDELVKRYDSCYT